MSNFIRKRRLTKSAAEIGPDSSKKQRLVDVTKVLLDVAKESSDWFPPLKSCLGGINALIKHYDEIKDVKEKLEDLAHWLAKLKGSLMNTNTDDDPEEAERRVQLEKSFDDIEKRSQALLGQGKMAQILDKAQGSQAIVRLVEQLRQAVLIYQMSQQQSIQNQVAQLASSFDKFLQLHKGSPGITGKIQRVLVRLDNLRVMVDTVADDGESKRRTNLFDTLEGIKDKLLLLSDHSGIAGYQQNKEDLCAVSELAEALRDAIVEYQFAQQMAIYEQNARLIDAAELLVLNTCPRARGAGYEHGDRQGCLTGTRETVLDEIESWTKDFNRSPVYWLNGVAGTGKSTIAQTTAERVFADGQLGASFFCSCDFKDRSNLQLIFPTLAFQLAYKYPDFRSILISLLQSKPDIGYESLHNQMERLIVTPLKEKGISTVIIIDALDECVDYEPQSIILSIMGRFVKEIPKVKFFITGRPEPRIHSGFRLQILKPLTNVFVLHEIERSAIDSDIRLFLAHQLSELAHRRGLDGWPSPKHIDLLCQRAAGLFVYAVATIKFLDSKTHLPSRRLKVIVNLPECTTPEGKTQFKPNTTLDTLYTSILQVAFSEEALDVFTSIQTTIGTLILLANPLPPSAIAELVGLELMEVMLFLTLIQSLLVFNGDPTIPVKLFHKSFPDFITDPTRCLDKRFYIPPGNLHNELILNGLRLMNNALDQNILSLPDYALNSEVMDLPKRIEDQISVALEYACKSWYTHLVKTREDVSDIISALHHFLEKKFLAWLEVLSALGAASNAITALETLIPWLKEVGRDQQLLAIARDCFNFVTRFFEVIKLSAPHIYHSALELSPYSAIVRELYYHHHPHPTPWVVRGVPSSWNQPLTIKTNYKFSTWSPCGKSLAVATPNNVEIWNIPTLGKCSTLQPTNPSHKLWDTLGQDVPKHSPSGIAYSPDGHSLACYSSSSTAIIIWDIQTGGVVNEIGCGGFGTTFESLAWSSDGKTVGAIFMGYQCWVVYVCNIALGTVVSPGMLQSSYKPCLWPHDKSIQVLTILNHEHISLSIYEIGPPLLRIKSFSISSTHDKLQTISFSPTTCRVSIVTCQPMLLVLNCQDSQVLLKKAGSFHGSCFSPDGGLLGAFGEEGVHIWKGDLQGDKCYLLWKTIPFWSDSADLPQGLQFSPTSSSVLILREGFLEVVHLDDAPPTKPPHQFGKISANSTYVVTADRGGHTVTITNLCSQIPPQFINIRQGIYGLALTGNVLLVEEPSAVVAWRLTAAGAVVGALDGRVADRSSSIWYYWQPLDIAVEYMVTDNIGTIQVPRLNPFCYNIDTGKSVSIQMPPPPTYKQTLADLSFHTHLHYHNFHECYNPPEDNQLASIPSYKAGWVKYPEGEHPHHFWLPAHWMAGCGENAYWLDDITTLWLHGNELVVIKF